MKWADQKNFKSNLISEHKGDEAGIKSSTIKVEGDYVFGWLKKESGIASLRTVHSSPALPITNELSVHQLTILPGFNTVEGIISTLVAM